MMSEREITFIVKASGDISEYSKIGIVGNVHALGGWNLGNVVWLVPVNEKERQQTLTRIARAFAGLLNPFSKTKNNHEIKITAEDENSERKLDEVQNPGVDCQDTDSEYCLWKTEKPVRIPSDEFPVRVRVVAKEERSASDPTCRHPLVWDRTSRKINLVESKDEVIMLEFDGHTTAVDRGWVTRHGIGACQLRVGKPLGRPEPLIDLTIKEKMRGQKYRIDLWSTGVTRYTPRRFERLAYAEMLFQSENTIALENERDEDSVLFILNTQNMEELEFRVDVTSIENGDLLARGYVPAAALSGLEGNLTVALVSPIDLSYIGTFNADFIVVKEFEHHRNNLGGLQRRLRTGDAVPTTLDIGHRGSGASRTHGHSVRENTMLSFEKAALNHSDFIEFDVHLSSDNEPVIHHDFQVKLSIAGEEIRVSVPTLSTEQLCSHSLAMAMMSQSEHHPHQHYSMEHGLNKRKGSTLKRTMTSAEEFIHSFFNKPHHSLSPTESDEALPARAFLSDKTATLRDALRLLPPSLGFNIELKYPKDEEAIAMRARYYSRNSFVDSILKVVFEEAGDRQIIFSSFDPDCTTLLSLKQPRYPVFFLTCGGTKHFKDPRMNSLEAALRFALASRLQGVVAEVQSVLDCLDEAVAEFHGHGLYLFTYGDLNNDINHYLAQRKAGIDAIIIDDVARIAYETKKKASRFLGLFGSGGSLKSLRSPVASHADLANDGVLVGSPGDIAIRDLDRLSSSLSIVTLCPVGSPQDDIVSSERKEDLTRPMEVPRNRRW